jgi:hypothetical protein
MTITASSHANAGPAELDPLTLDGDDVAALRLADCVSFCRHEQQNYILAWLRGGHEDDLRVFTAQEQRLFPGTAPHIPDRKRRIDCAGSVYGYPPEDNQRAWDHLTKPGVICYEPNVGGRYSDTWTTLAGLLKPGDRLWLRWTADISQALRHDYGLHRDTLHLIIQRGEERLTFLLADRVTVNNSARMIRPYS